MKPLIAIATDRETVADRLALNQQYTRAVEAAGGIPLVIPVARDADPAVILADRLDALMLVGGADVDPAFFNEPPLPVLKEVDPERDTWELALVRAFLDRDKPVLAICRGAQFLNVATGGTLYQDLGRPGVWKHRQQAAAWYGTHQVGFEPGSKLEGIFGVRSLLVNSHHHMAIREVAPGWEVTASTGDGIVEGLESQSHRWAVGVQWHPETLWERDPQHHAIFRALVQVCND